MTISKDELAELEKHLEAHLEVVLEQNKPRFWHLNLPQLITVSTVVIGGIVSMTQFYGRLDATEKLVAIQTARLEQLDTGGTQFSRIRTGMDDQRIISHEQRLQRLEDVNTKLAVIQTQMSALQTDVSDIKSDMKANRTRPQP